MFGWEDVTAGTESPLRRMGEAHLGPTRVVLDETERGSWGHLNCNPHSGVIPERWTTRSFSVNIDTNPSAGARGHNIVVLADDRPIHLTMGGSTI